MRKRKWFLIYLFFTVVYGAYATSIAKLSIDVTVYKPEHNYFYLSNDFTEIKCTIYAEEMDSTVTYIRSKFPEINNISFRFVGAEPVNVSSLMLNLDGLKIISIENFKFGLRDKFFNVEEIEQIDISRGSISNVDSLFPVIQALKSFSVTNVKIGHLPYSLKNSLLLEYINVNYSDISDLPFWLTECDNLKHLTLTNNDIKSVDLIFLNDIKAYYIDLSRNPVEKQLKSLDIKDKNGNRRFFVH